MARYFFVLVFILPVFLCFSQTEKDSLLHLITTNKKDTAIIHALIELSIIESDNLAESKRYGKQAIELANALNDKKARLSAYVNMLKLYRAAGPTDTALYFVNLSQEVATQLSDANSIAEIKLDAGNVYLNAHNYLKALSEFVEAARILDSLKINPKSQMVAYANIGNVEEMLDNYEKALNYVKRGLAIANEIKYEAGVAYSYKTMGRIYRKLKNLDLAESAYRQSLISYEKMGDHRMISELHQNLGTVYF
jgi:tetratricopeptide (TPR) repeat protein